MSKFFLTYDQNNELVATYINNKGNNLIKGAYLSSFLKMVESLKDVSVLASGSNSVELVVNDDKIIINDANNFFSDKRNEHFANSLGNYGFSVQRYMEAKNKKKEKVVVKTKENEYKEKPQKRKKKINRGISISAVGASVVLLAALLNSQWDYMHGKPLPNEFKFDFDVAPITDVFKNSPKEPVALDLSAPVSYDDYYDFLDANYYSAISKYSRIYGVDPILMMRIACENKSIAVNATLSDGRYGLMGLDLEALKKSGVAAYNFSVEGKPKVELAYANEDAVTNSDYHFKVAIMLFQQRLRQLDYNIMGAVQSMGMTESAFREAIVQYGIQKYGDNLAFGSQKEDYYIKLVMADKNDLGWLDQFIDENGKIFVYDILSHYNEYSNINIKVCKDDVHVETLSYVLNGNNLSLNDGSMRLG